MKLHRFAAVVACLTFVLLLMGGLVHNTRSSLACPDWPLCFGSAFPKMEGGVLVEHSHRLMATTVGLLTTLLMALCIRRARRSRDPGLIPLGIGAFLCVVFQGVLGGITVIYRLPTIVSTAHLATSMFFFSILLYAVFRLRPEGAQPAAPLSPLVRRATLAAALVVYAQMILGAFMRHLGAGLACVELPLCHGSLWPTGVHPNVLVHMTHRILGVAVFLAVAAASVTVVREARTRSARVLAGLAPVLVLVQITLGVMSITSFLDVVPVTAHLGVAALLYGDLLVLHLIARGDRKPTAADGALSSFATDGADLGGGVTA
jgi:heme A synthase